MEKEINLGVSSIERDGQKVKLSYKYLDNVGRLYGNFESEELYPLSEPTSNEATYLDGSVETPYGNFMFECKIAEAKKALGFIADFIKEKGEIIGLEKQIVQAKNRLFAAQEKYRQGAEPDYEASSLVDDLQRRKLQLETNSKIHEEWLEKYKV